MNHQFPLMRHGRRSAILRCVISIVSLALLVFVSNLTTPAQATARRPWSANPAADGSVTDSNRDGIGDVLLDGQNSVVVGFNALGPGEHRGIYQFDLRSAPPIRHNDHVILYLNRTGTRMDGTSDHLTLYAGRGTGTLRAADYAAGRFVTAFDSVELGPTLDWYDNLIDVTRAVEHLMHQRAHYVVFVIRPNPSASAGQGAILFSSNETADNVQFVPAKLVIQKGK